MQINYSNRIYSIFFIFLGITALLISSCRTPSITEITGITPTPVTPSPTLRICPPDTDLENLDGLEITPTFIIVLFDANSNFVKPMEYLSGDTTQNTMEFVSAVLPKALGPGSQYSLFSLGFRHYEAAKLDRYSSKISEAPEIVPTPQAHETLTPIPSPTKSDVVLENQAGKNHFEATVEAQNATATQAAFEDDCAIVAYDEIYKLTATAWSVTQQAEANEIGTQISVAQAERTERIQILETPFASENVYEGLSHVTVDFESQCSNYKHCILMIFDNLEDWRPITPDYLHINLEGVDVISVLPQCDDIIQPSCVQVQDKWKPLFESYKAKSLQYYNGERLEEYLTSYLGGK